MDFSLNEWLNLIVRWVHVFAGILWIGQTYLFTWLDARFSAEEAAADKENPGARVWMVHSGGFYVVAKEKAPAALPRKLQWFRWEAAVTWLSGMVLLTIVYYAGGIMVDNDVARIPLVTAIALGLGLIFLGWFVYDFLARSPVGRSEPGMAVVCFVLVVGMAYGLCHVLSGRAAYLHVGALFGTVMAANVWLRILPAQRQMIAAIQAGEKPDAPLAAQAKLRSKHNTFMVVPVVFIMISNHFAAATYGNKYNWEILAVLILAGWAAAKILRSA